VRPSRHFKGKERDVTPWVASIALEVEVLPGKSGNNHSTKRVFSLDVPQRNKADSRDGTDEYDDLADRIKNKPAGTRSDCITSSEDWT
jgi:hypothetical protein